MTAERIDPPGRPGRRLIELVAIAVITASMSACAAFGLRPEPPVVAIDSVRPLSMSFDRQVLEFRLEISNPNPFSLPLEGLDFTASLAGESIATGTSRESIDIPARGDAIVAVTVDASVGRVLERLRRMLEERELVLDYTVDGTVLLANWPRPLPFDVRGDVQP